MIKKIVKLFASIIKNPYLLIPKCDFTPLFHWIPDKEYLELCYKGLTQKKLDLINPRTYNEKIQWLKLYDHNPLYFQLADKYEVRKYVAEHAGEEYLIPLIGGPWNSFEEIDFSVLPDKYVIKCTHDSGSVFICDQKDKTYLNHIKRKINAALRRNYYYNGREWAYKEIPPRIIAESYMVDESGIELKDYKFFCFHGEPKMIQVDFGRFHKHMRNIYTIEWEYIPMEIKYPTNADNIIPRPDCLDKMLDISKKLSKGLPHVRIDLYCIKDKIYFGEMTFYHGSGYEKFTPDYYDEYVGTWLTLPNHVNTPY